MVEAAQLAAVPGEGAGLRGGDREVVRVAGDDVPLEQELRHPERVDHVRRGEVELDRLADRDLEHRQRPLAPIMYAVGGDGPAVGDLVVRVVELPGPLEAGHVDRDGRVARHRVDRVLVLGGVVEEHRDEHERHDRVQDLDRHVVAHLRRELVTAPAVEDHRPEDHAPHHGADEQAGDPRALPQGQRDRALRGDGVREAHAGEVVIPRATGEREQHGGKRADAHRVSPAAARGSRAVASTG